MSKVDCADYQQRIEEQQIDECRSPYPPGQAQECQCTGDNFNQWIHRGNCAAAVAATPPQTKIAKERDIVRPADRHPAGRAKGAPGRQQADPPGQPVDAYIQKTPGTAAGKKYQYAISIRHGIPLSCLVAIGSVFCAPHSLIGSSGIFSENFSKKNQNGPIIRQEAQ